MTERQSRAIRAAAIVALLAPGSVAWSMDCGRATTAIETAICANPAARAQDTALSRLYFATLRRLSGRRHDTLIEDQRLWLADRTQDCTGAKSPADCIGKATTARIAQISACYEGDTPDPSAGSMSCAISVHAACPRWQMSASASVWSFPFLVKDIEARAARLEKDAPDASVCAPEAKNNPGRPDDNDEANNVTIEGSGNGWVAVRTVDDSESRGGAHPNHWETVATYEPASGKAFPITRLMPRLRTDERVGDRFWDAASKHGSKPCCGDDDGPLEAAGLERDAGEDAAGHPLPVAWAIAPDGSLKVFYSYYALGRTFVATSSLARSTFIGWIDTRYAALFAAGR